MLSSIVQACKSMMSKRSGAPIVVPRSQSTYRKPEWVEQLEKVLDERGAQKRAEEHPYDVNFGIRNARMLRQTPPVATQKESYRPVQEQHYRVRARTSPVQGHQSTVLPKTQARAIAPLGRDEMLF